MPKTKAKAIIFLNGNLADLNSIKRYIDQHTLIIGCDGGTAHIYKLGLKPDVIIGDFDSLKEIPLAIKKAFSQDISQQVKSSGILYIKYPAEKDFTDSELAIKYVQEIGIGEIILAGFMGDRIDHMLGNILLLAKNEFSELGLKIVDGRQEAFLLRGNAQIKGKAGDIISFIPIEGSAKVKYSSGLKYDPSKYVMSPQKNRGISNELTKNTAEINLEKGTLLVVHRRSTKTNPQAKD